MLPCTLEHLASMIDATATATATANANPIIQGFSIDSRKTMEGDLFIALKGARDGHDFLQDAANRGAKAALVSRSTTILPSVCVVDTQSALTQLATRLRDDYRGVVFALTGSQGKTSTRGFLRAILNQMADPSKVLATQGNLNNHLGVPLTMSCLRQKHQFALFELGASALGEIGQLTSIIRPKISGLLNAREAHLEGFGSIEGVIEGKGEIIEKTDPNGTVVLNRDDMAFDTWRQRTGSRQIISFGQKQGDVIWTPISEQEVRLDFGDRQIDVHLATLGKHFMANAAAAAAMAFSYDASDRAIRLGLEEAYIEDGRMTPIRIGTQLVIDDTYNASPHSVRAAIDWLSLKKGGRVVIMGGLTELGSVAKSEMAALGIYAREKGIERLIATGSGLPIAEGFGPSAIYIEALNNLISKLSSLTTDANIILVKGSRSERMDRVVEAFKQMEGER